MKPYKVLVTARSFGTADNKAAEILEKNGCEIKKITDGDVPLAKQLKEELPTSDAVIAGLEKYDRELIRSAVKLKIISRYGVGLDNVDVTVAKERSIAVTTTPGANGESVADMAVALMLACARNISCMDRGIKGGTPVRPQGIELWRKTVGIVGAGRIGKGVARRCAGFGMRILCFDQYEDRAFASELGARYTDFKTLIQESDFITIHSPLTDETRNMFSKAEFEAMKKDAILVNTARGGIVDEDALYNALVSGQIRGAGLDASVSEPEYKSALCTLENCVITPHAGAATKEASSRMSLMAAQNVVDALYKRQRAGDYLSIPQG